MEEVGAGIVAAGGQEVAGSGVHGGVVAFLAGGGAEEVGDVPHGDGGGYSEGAIEDPVGGDEAGFGAVPVVEGEGGGGAGEDAVDYGDEPEFGGAEEGADLGAVGPAGDVHEVVGGYDEELEGDEEGEEGLEGRGHGRSLARGVAQDYASGPLGGEKNAIRENGAPGRPRMRPPAVNDLS